MRIGVDTRELADRPTGVGRYLIELLARWTRDAALARHELILFAPGVPAGPRPWLGRGGATVRDEVARGGAGTRWEQTALARGVNRLAPDVFFAPGYTAPLAAACPLVVAIHDVSFAAHPEWFGWREGVRRRLVTGRAARKARRVITISAFSRDEIVEHLGLPREKVVVTPLAVDTHPSLIATTGASQDRLVSDTPGRADAAGSRMVLYVGSILERRHVPELLAAFARVAARVPDATLEIVGDNRSHGRVDPSAIAARLGVGDRVGVRDYVDEATLAELYAGARVFAFLSSYEGFGLPPLEAMHAGVPAVVLDTAVSREVYGDAALMVDLSRPSTLDDALTGLLERDDLRQRHLDAAARLLARYSWDATARQTMDILLAAAR